MAKDIRIVIIEDDKIIRDGYALLISQADGCEVMNTYASFDDAVKGIGHDDPEVILLDIELPGISGIDAIPRLKKLLPTVQILILTVYESENFIFDALSNGALGYLTKNSSPERIIDAIKDVKQGGGPMSANIARMVITSFQRNPDTPLSKRETQILELIASGKSRARIAQELFIDFETVRTHVRNIYAKLDVNSKVDAIKTAKENKLI